MPDHFVVDDGSEREALEDRKEQLVHLVVVRVDHLTAAVWVEGGGDNVAVTGENSAARSTGLQKGCWLNLNFELI